MEMRMQLALRVADPGSHRVEDAASKVVPHAAQTRE